MEKPIEVSGAHCVHKSMVIVVQLQH